MTDNWIESDVVTLATPPVRSQSTVGQSNEFVRIRLLLRCCNCKNTQPFSILINELEAYFLYRTVMKTNDKTRTDQEAK